MRNHANVLGVAVSAIDMVGALQRVDCAVREGTKGYVCVTGVHGVMEAQDDPAFRNILNNAFLNTPDGMPTVWVGRLQGHADMKRVYGPDLMLSVFRQGVDRGYRHFFLGGKAGVAVDLERALVGRFPAAQVVGTYTPPFRPLDEDEDRELIEQVRKARPDIICSAISG